jgi:chemotaxis protein histidine kinase CheA
VKREVPDWAYDKHTAKGKAQGRGYEHFFETMITAPRLISGDDMFEKEAKALYLNGKEQRVRHILAASDTAKATAKAEEKAKKAEEKKAAKAEEKAKKAEAKKAAKAEEKAKEKARKAEEKKAAKESAKAAGPQYVPDTAPPAEYMNVLQIQPITGRSKPRVWFATAPDGKQVVIKGPLKADEVLANINSEVAKKTLGLPSVNLHAEEVDGKTYLVSDNLLGDRTAFLPTRTVTTKLEKDVRVVDVEKATLSTWEHEMLNDDEKARNLLVALAFRKVIGANDTCNRNLVVVGNAVYSVDDPALHKETPYMWSKALVKPKTSYEAALEKHWDHVVKVLESWKAKVDEEGKKQIDALSAKDGWKW